MKEQEWNAFVDRTWSLFYGQALNILKEPADAEDVVKDVYYKILKAGYPLKEAGFISPTIIKNICINLIQRKKLLYEKNKLIHTSTRISNRSSNIHIHDMDMKYILKKIKDSLTDRQYTILMLFVKGHSYKEISEKFSINVITVKTTIHKAIKNIEHLKHMII